MVVSSLKYCIDNKGLLLHAWVLMNNHVHLIISSKENKLENIVRDMKRHTSRTLLEAIADNPQESRRDWVMWLFKSAGKENPNNEMYQFWQQDNHPILLDTNEKTRQKLNYLHDNPVRARITYAPEHYVYSSAIDYFTDSKGLLPIELLL